MKTLDLKKKVVDLRVCILESINRAGEGCSGAAISCLDILVALYYGVLVDGPVLRFDPKKPGCEGQDYFILSKFAAAPALYAVLADLGFFDRDDLKHLSQLNSRLQPAPHKKIPGVTATIGGAGYGLSFAVGLGLALRVDRKKNQVFVLVEDSELQKGQFWEAVMSAPHFMLDNMIMIVEWCGLQRDGALRAVMNVEPLVEKFEAFGWKVFKVNDGHNPDELLDVLNKAVHVARKPKVIICRTTLAKGIPFAENKPYYYGSALSDEEMAEVITLSRREMGFLNDIKS